MLSKEENDFMTQTAPGTPAGDYFRHYWMPVALSEELPPGGAPLPLKIMHEDLVLFRDETGRPGLLGIHCSHRGADLSYGRVEDGGLRCIYHGWLYDRSGRCLEQPGEPAGSSFHERIRHVAYPCEEVAGLIFAYMGQGDPPPLPLYEPLLVAEEYRNVSKVFMDCNYLQGQEGDHDSAHLAFLHRFFTDAERSWSLSAADEAPAMEPEDTDFGVRMYAVRRISPTENYVRVSNYVLPNFSCFPAGGHGDGYTGHWRVPIDDTHHWRVNVTFERQVPVGPANKSHLDAAYHLVRNRANRYLQDRDEMQRRSFSGMGRVFVVQDACATEGAGPIQDRTQEHLAYTDRTIIATRKALMNAIQAVQEGREAPNRAAGPERYRDVIVKDEVVPATVDWREYWAQPAEVH